jgi:predicted metal-dependent hydrolase
VVVLTLPPRADRSAGMALLMNHLDWVAARIAALPAGVLLADGAQVPLDGISHRIRHRPEARGGAWLCDGEIHVAGAPEFLVRRVTDFLKAEARTRLGNLAFAKATGANLKVRRISVKDTSSRWGSCAPDGSIAFSWRLVMAPTFVQDYVTAHEVAHLRHMNHGRHFWELVDQLTNHAQAAIAWLKKEGPALMQVR